MDLSHVGSNSLENEKRIIATVMANPDVIHAVREELGEAWCEHFQDPQAYAVARTIERLAGEHRICDFHTVAREAAAAHAEEYRPYIESPLMVRGRCAELWRDAAIVKLVQTGRMIEESEGQDPAGLLEEVYGELQKLRGMSLVAQTMNELVGAVLEQYKIQEQDPDALLGIPSGIPELDRVLSGFQQENLYLLGGRPSHGKTALADNIILAAAHAGFPVLVLAHEMGGRAHVRRMLAIEGDMLYQSIEHASLYSKGEGRLRAAAERLRNLPIRICSRTGAAPEQYQAQAHTVAREKGPGLVVLDYIQLERIPESTIPRVDELARISAGWLETARATGHAVLALSQLSRKGEGSAPRLSHLRESGALEQDAHAVLLLYRPGVDDQDVDPTQAQLAVAKNRSGSLGMVKLDFEGPKMRFTQAEGAEETEEFPDGEEF